MREEDECRSVKRIVKFFMLWDGNLLRHTKNGLMCIPFMKDRVALLRILHDFVSHWDRETKRKFFRDRYFLPIVHQYIHNYAKSFDGFQKAKPLSLYWTTLNIQFKNIFDFLVEIDEKSSWVAVSLRNAVRLNLNSI